MRLLSLSLTALLAGCGSSDEDSSGRLTAAFDDQQGDVADLDAPCVLMERDDGYSVSGIDEEYGIEVIWKTEGVAGPDTYASDLLGDVVVFALFPDPDDPTTNALRRVTGAFECAG